MKLAKLSNGTFIDLNFAEKVVKENNKTEKNKWGKEELKLFGGLTTSKLRGLLELVNTVYTKVYNSSDKELSPEIIDDLEYLKVKFAYEAGRESAVKQFIDKTFIRQLLDTAINKGTKKYFLDYCKYFEALVAYAKYYKMGD